MALPSKYSIDKKINSMEGLGAYENGGKGSGNFGHSGRPGEVGGSGSGKTQLQRAAEAEATSGKVGHFAGLQYIDEIYKEKLGKIKDDLSRLKEVKDRYGYVDANDPAHNRLDELKGQLARAKELAGSNVPEAQQTKFEKLGKLVDEIEEITGWRNSTDGAETLLNGGKGSGNWGHAGRPGEIGGSASGGSSGKIRVHEGSRETEYYYAEDGDRVLASGKTPEEALAKAIAGSKKNIDQAKIVQEDIEDRIGQKVKKGEEYSALDEASTSRFKYFHGEDGTEYTYDKGNGMITKTNPKTGDQEVVTKQKKDYSSERRGVSARDGSGIGNEFADLSSELETARTNLKMLKEDKGKAYKDLSGRLRFMDRSAEISRSLHYAQLLRKGRLSKETKKLVKEMESELKSIRDEYDKLGTEKYFDPDLNHEN